MKELPYFKFYCNEWITGEITFLDYEAQGLFINLCAFYWSKNGTLSLSNAKKRFKVSEDKFTELIDSEIIKVSEDKITINFLDEQMNERGQLSKTNSKNGSLGGRPKKQTESENKPTALILESETKAKKSNIEEKRREEKRKEESKKEDIDNRKLKFSSTLKPFLDLYGKDLLNQFYAYWTEPNKSNTKFKQELEKTWSLDRRLETWAKNDKSFNNGKQNTNSAIQTPEQRKIEHFKRKFGVDISGGVPNKSNDQNTHDSGNVLGQPYRIE